MLNGIPVRRNVTDRALRYRANQEPPEGPRVCGFCGSRQNVEVGHIDGHEENTEPENLIWTCRSCNVIAANVLRAAGLGRPTNQYNPSKSGGASTIGEWMQAVGGIVPQEYSYRNEALRPASTMSAADAVAMIRATPVNRRRDFAAQLRRHR
jgi:hypothetical protein